MPPSVPQSENSAAEPRVPRRPRKHSSGYMQWLLSPDSGLPCDECGEKKLTRALRYEATRAVQHGGGQVRGRLALCCDCASEPKAVQSAIRKAITPRAPEQTDAE